MWHILGLVKPHTLYVTLGISYFGVYQVMRLISVAIFCINSRKSFFMIEYSYINLQQIKIYNTSILYKLVCNFLKAAVATCCE